ncbi:TetR/AcrR family transcriptional regulator [Sphaerisporangium corydalis]|uniref:TetR/AcrR family transcriptional regulator n=1 Tax=Sphaerisporangium corydalis TaxID=1441875 RepID=A0ABV9E9K4_9ACTN|nr:TetR/AcrR family transcriptional regulator [Sphaerisporangium corydalis]
MPSPDTDAQARRPEQPQREERAHRILDAAAELILRWGYDKTTIDDVARSAGVAKGTIYLHWKSREALFAALLRRDRVAMLEQVRNAVAGPGGVTPRDLYRHLALALMARPLVRAALLGDTEVLGKLIRQKPKVQTVEAVRSLAGIYLTTLREHGAIREDLTPVEQVNMISATMYGFFVITPQMPEEYQVSGERLADLLAETLHRALDSGRTLSPEQSAAITRATLAYLDRGLGLARDRLHLSLTTSDMGKDYVR